jgi:hypothetical protein
MAQVTFSFNGKPEATAEFVVGSASSLPHAQSRKTRKPKIHKTGKLEAYPTLLSAISSAGSFGLPLNEPVAIAAGIFSQRCGFRITGSLRAVAIHVAPPISLLKA